MGIQAVKGVEIGDGFALARLRGSEAHDEIDPASTAARTAPGGIEAGISNGEPIVVRAAMKPLPTLMRPLESVDLESGEPASALVERSDVAGGRGARGRRGGGSRLRARVRSLDKFGGDAIVDVCAAHQAYLARIGDRWQPR